MTDEVMDAATTAESPPLDRGVTFIELLISIVLLGAAGVAVLLATTAAITGARTSDQVAKSQEALAEAADYLTDLEPENVVYQSCVPPNNPAGSYQAALDTQFGTGVIQVVHVLYWDQNPGAFGTSCEFATSQGDRLQQIRLRTDTNGSVREVDVVKRPFDVPTMSTVKAPSPPEYTGGSGQVDVSLTPNLP